MKNCDTCGSLLAASAFMPPESSTCRYCKVFTLKSTCTCLKGRSLLDYQLLMEEYGLPDYMVDGVHLYVERGIEPGDFLRSLFDNDLFGAIQHADRSNCHKLLEWATFIFNHLPSGCWGHISSVIQWTENFDK